MPPQPEPQPVLVLACGALARDLGAVLGGRGFEHVAVEYLPGVLHNRPDQIPAAIEARLDAIEADPERELGEVVLAYADCGTGGRLDEVCRRRGLTRLPGPHCYSLLAGHDRFERLHDDEPGTLYLTDYLTRHFDVLVWGPLGLDRHPELLATYFGNYRRVVHLAQDDDPDLRQRAADAADRLGLAFEHILTGRQPLEAALADTLSTPVELTGPRR